MPAGAPIPSNASITCIWGDGSVAEPIPLDFTSTPASKILSYTFASPGAYQTTIMISNLASTQNFTLSVSVNFLFISKLNIAVIFKFRLKHE
jgi:hypothetical protein